MSMEHLISSQDLRKNLPIDTPLTVLPPLPVAVPEVWKSLVDQLQNQLSATPSIVVIQPPVKPDPLTQIVF